MLVHIRPCVIFPGFPRRIRFRISTLYGRIDNALSNHDIDFKYSDENEQSTVQMMDRIAMWNMTY
jgi:hypothetical protein